MSDLAESIAALAIAFGYLVGFKTGRACSWCPHGARYPNECSIPRAEVRRRR